MTISKPVTVTRGHSRGWSLVLMTALKWNGEMGAGGGGSYSQSMNLEMKKAGSPKET
jgi:hypothetical protein